MLNADYSENWFWFPILSLKNELQSGSVNAEGDLIEFANRPHPNGGTNT